MRHNRTKQNWLFCQPNLSLHHRGQTSEESHQKRNYISMIKMREEYETEMGGKLCKVSLIQAGEKKKSISILSFLKGHKE